MGSRRLLPLAGPLIALTLAAAATPGCTTPLPLVDLDGAARLDAGADAGSIATDANIDAASAMDAPSDATLLADVGPSDAGSPDARLPDAGPPDAGPPPCMAGTLFGAPTLITSLSDMMFNDDGLTVSPDELEAVVRSGLENTFYLHTRSDTASPFGPAVPTGVSLVNTDSAPFLGRDPLELLFASERMTPPLEVIWRSTRASRTAAFAAPTRVTFALSLTDMSDPFLVGSTLYLSATGPSRAHGLFAATRLSATTFGAPALITELDTSNDEQAPVVSEDGLEIFFARDGAGTGDDVLSATRTSSADAFGPTRNLTALRSNNAEWPEALSSDGCRLYFISDRGGRWNAYVTNRAPP